MYRRIVKPPKMKPMVRPTPVPIMAPILHDSSHAHKFGRVMCLRTYLTRNVSSAFTRSCDYASTYVFAR